uniref:Small ribosomal subunit protein uS3c n=1 Tax=Lepocinclis ovum TaxID=86638 RepID=A0A3G3LM03_9EUGL|nr:ribosomal protein S3 [Lepocinclis ovum]AYQ93740.1 ribosomal protein S3 [Lepocinclis ovum]
MGQKVSPLGFRIGITKDHNSCWFATNKKYSSFLAQDMFIRRYIQKEFNDVSISNIFIKRKLDLVTIDVYLAKTGSLFSNSFLDDFNKNFSKILFNEFKVSLLSLNVVEVKDVDMCSYLVAESIKKQLEKRLPFRKVIKSAVTKSLKAGVKGIKVQISGRLNGAEIARSEWIRQGQVPLHTLKANIDYCSCRAQTIFGVLGIKVWLYIN